MEENQIVRDSSSIYLKQIEQDMERQLSVLRAKHKACKEAVEGGINNGTR